MTTLSQGLWYKLKTQQRKRADRPSRSVSTPALATRPFGMLENILTIETKRALLLSGAAARMRTPHAELRPLGLLCETVNICNADCIFCPYSRQTRKFGTMSSEMFETVCRQYLEMGGGPMSLTPMVGDVLLDNELPARLRTLQQHRQSISPSVTTNLYALGRHSDDVVLQMLETFRRIHVSTYGMTAEENAAITQRKHFAKYVAQGGRLGELWERSSKSCEVVVGFRNLYRRQRRTLRSFVQEVFGHDWLAGDTVSYCNWGGTMRGSLPGDAVWVDLRTNHAPCLLLITAMQVYWDGRVSACACCDYDAGRDLGLGTLTESTLSELYNGAVNRQIWADQERGRMQSICQNCTFHVPLRDLQPSHPLLRTWVDFVGG